MEIFNALRLADNLSVNENSIRNYIIEHPLKATNITITELAKECYTSPATVTRLCKKLGIDSFIQLKINLSAELLRNENNHYTVDEFYNTKNNYNQIEEIINKINSSTIKSIENTTNLINIENYVEIAKIINSSSAIDFFGNGSSNIVANDIAFKFMRIGKIVCFFDIVDRQVIQSLVANKDRIGFIISYSGENKDIIRIANNLKNKKITTIALTCNNGNSLSKLVDYLIPVSSSEPMLRKISMSSRLSMSYALDILFNICYILNYDEYKKISDDTYFI